MSVIIIIIIIKIIIIIMIIIIIIITNIIMMMIIIIMIIIIIIIPLFQENDIFGTDASLTYGPQLIMVLIVSAPGDCLAFISHYALDRYQTN